MSATRASAHLRGGANAVPAVPARQRVVHEISLAGTTLVADPAGALHWPDEELLAVADLHLEKGSAFAARGVLLPPYDTAETLARLAGVMAHYAAHGEPPLFRWRRPPSGDARLRCLCRRPQRA